MRINARPRSHHSAHDKAHTRYLEHTRARLVRELAAVNAQLRRGRSGGREEDEAGWDFDPRTTVEERV